jgi:NAD(P)-dependent dehydrogenase (short-subunit alcohol dehydrogenase family)
MSMSERFGATSTTDDVLADRDLSGKRALVTGVSAGLGVETARALAAHGVRVVGAARDLAKAERATAPVRAEAAKGGRLELVELDLESLASVRACASAHRTADVDLEDPNFRHTEYHPFIAYARSKTANVLFAVECDRRHRARGVRATAVHPGGIHTELGRHVDLATLVAWLTEMNAQLAAMGKPPFQLKSVAR